MRLVVERVVEMLGGGGDVEVVDGAVRFDADDESIRCSGVGMTGR